MGGDCLKLGDTTKWWEWLSKWTLCVRGVKLAHHGSVTWRIRDFPAPFTKLGVGMTSTWRIWPADCEFDSPALCQRGGWCFHLKGIMGGCNNKPCFAEPKLDLCEGCIKKKKSFKNALPSSYHELPGNMHKQNQREHFILDFSQDTMKLWFINS